jgi:hypothetical protein
VAMHAFHSVAQLVCPQVTQVGSDNPLTHSVEHLALKHEAPLVMHDLQVAENLVSFSKQVSMQVTGVELKAQSNPHPAASDVRRG